MKALLFLMTTAILWGLNFHLAKIMLKEVAFIEAGFWRYLFGVIPLMILVFRDCPKWQDIRQNLKGMALVGIICLFGFNLFFFLGLVRSSAINAALIVSLTPALTLLFSRIILKTELKPKHLIGVAISFLGVLYLIFKGKFSSFQDVEFSSSDFLILISATFFALQNVWVKKYGGKISNISFTFFTNLFCMLSFMVLLPFVGMENVFSHSTSFWLSSIGIGCFGTAIAYLLWNAGIKLTSANQAGIFINVVPLSTAMFSIILGEALFGYHLISGLFILGGILILRR